MALDPSDPRIIYVGGPRNLYASAATVCRSVDGGATWTNLSATAPGPDGPHEVSAIRVNPSTHEAWANGQCYGMWRIAPPLPGERGVSALLASAPEARTPPYPSPLPFVEVTPSVLNGDMEAGAATPNNWAVSWTGSGKLLASRDTTQHHGGGAALKLASDGGAAKGQAAQFIDAAPGASFTVSGWVKTNGTESVNFAVQPLNSSWGPIAFLQVGYAQNTTGWTHFEKKVTIPAGTSHVAIVLLLDGTGTAWLDNVTISQ